MIKSAKAGDTIVQLECRSYVDNDGGGFDCTYIEHTLTEDFKWDKHCIQLIHVVKNPCQTLVNPFTCYPTLKAAQRAYKSMLRNELQFAQLKVKVISERLAELNKKDK